jgi:hypothetical protein
MLQGAGQVLLHRICSTHHLLQGNLGLE